MDYLKKLIGDIELHSVEGIKECFANGISPSDLFHDRPLIEELISQYTRSPRFKDCVKAFIDAGLQFPQKELLAVLSDDADALEQQLQQQPLLIYERYTLRCAYTPLYKATLFHICAEFNHLACARVLWKFDADINAKAGIDEYGFGGQTPIFHTVNQNSNNSAEIMYFLLAAGADLHVTVPGLIWGRGYQWETFIPSVNPVSYAMMGLLPQMHRNEKTTMSIVSQLVNIAYNIDYTPANVPNAYLK